MYIELKYGEAVTIGSQIELRNCSHRKIFVDAEGNDTIPIIGFDKTQMAIQINGLKAGDTLEIYEVSEVNYKGTDDDTSKLLRLQYKIRDAYSMEYRINRDKITVINIKKYWKK